MASTEASEAKILARIEEICDSNSHASTNAAAILQLAEAYAWVRFPNQAHGGTTTVKSS